MEFRDKTKEELIDELENKLQRISELEELQAKSLISEDELKASEERLKILFEYAPDAYYLSSIKGNLVDGNKAAEEMVGYKKGELIGKNFSDLKILPKNQLPLALKNLAKNALGFPTGPDEFNLTPKDGKQITTEIRTYPVKIKGQKLVLGIARDITERKKIEDALRTSEENYRQVVERANDGIIIIHEQKIVFSNKSFARMSGYSVAELEGLEFIRLVPKELHAMIADRVKRRLAGEDLTSIYELDLIRKNGTKFVVDVNAGFVEIKGEPSDLVILRDITDRKKTEKALQESEEKFRELFNNANDMISLNEIKADGRPGNFIEINEVGMIRLGYNYDEFLKMTPADIVAPDKRSQMRKNVIELQNKGYVTFEIVHLREDGKRIPVEVNNHLFELKGKKVALAISRDITERKEAEEEIKKSLKEKEMLLKEIHHRVKNNLMIISSLLNLQSGYIKDKASKDIFKESQNRARSMALIHERLYQSTDLKNIDFGEYITSLATELFHTYVADSSVIELKINVDDIYLDINTAIPLGLIVNELITNSLKYAFPKGMKGEIIVDFHPIADNYEFTVKDNGIGFPEDLDYKNTDSLGLQMVTSLTDQIDGKIQFERNNGTEFKIIFKEVI